MKKTHCDRCDRVTNDEGSKVTLFGEDEQGEFRLIVNAVDRRGYGIDVCEACMRRLMAHRGIRVAVD